MFKKMILVLVVLSHTYAIAQNVKTRQDNCSDLSPIFVEELSKMFRNQPPIADDYYKPFFLLRFFNLDSGLYFTMGYCETYPPAIEVQGGRIELDTNCIYYYSINGYNLLISDYCFSIGYGLYFPCHKTNQQALIEKSTSPPYISMGKTTISYGPTYQVLRDSIIQVPLIIPIKYEGEEYVTLKIVPEKQKKGFKNKVFKF